MWWCYSGDWYWSSIASTFFVLPMADSTFQDAVVSDRFHAWIALYHPFEYGMLEVWSGFLRGILWSSIALCVSAYISDPFVVLVSPYFVSFLLFRHIVWVMLLIGIVWINC